MRAAVLVFVLVLSFVGEAVAAPGDDIDKLIAAAQPRVHRYANFDRAASPILVLGLPGRWTSSESFIRFLTAGLKGSPITRRLVLAAIQDPATSGPPRQGIRRRDRANRWRLTTASRRALGRFVTRLARRHGCQQIVIIGYSSGGAAAPRLAAWLVNRGTRGISDVVILAARSRVSGVQVRKAGLRLLFLDAPSRRGKSGAESSHARLFAEGAETLLRIVRSATQHPSRHWGLISTCRYFVDDKPRPGAGSWPHYRRPNPETFAYITPFLTRQPVPLEKAAPPHLPCPTPR
jgi:hypothetical protein